MVPCAPSLRLWLAYNTAPSNTHTVYEQTKNFAWDEASKREELFNANARYLFLRGDPKQGKETESKTDEEIENSCVAFVHFRYELVST